ncbi:MAG: HIT domain-containing protein, partial [Phycisphaerales bacterium]|nr:HIT domain-containing protein [Phycisphaerales bacterium]
QWQQSYKDILSEAEKAGTGVGYSADGASAGGAKGGGQGGGQGGGKGNCFLREYWLHPERDEANLVVARTGPGGDGPGGLVLLNRYPYANGHLLVCLGVGRMRLLEYTPAQRAELWSLTDLAVELCERALEPQGVNVGVNQGTAAGAGVPEHVHVHVVPRWSGDVNFMSAVGQVRVVPGALEAMWKRYRAVWERVREG